MTLLFSTHTHTHTHAPFTLSYAHEGLVPVVLVLLHITKTLKHSVMNYRSEHLRLSCPQYSPHTLIIVATQIACLTQ